MEYEVESPRPTGRPERTWREVVKEDCLACKLNIEDAMDHSKWRKLIKDVRWSGWVLVGDCFFWYRPTRVVLGQRPLNGCVFVFLSQLGNSRPVFESWIGVCSILGLRFRIAILSYSAICIQLLLKYSFLLWCRYYFCDHSLLCDYVCVTVTYCSQPGTERSSGNTVLIARCCEIWSSGKSLAVLASMNISPQIAMSSVLLTPVSWQLAVSSHQLHYLKISDVVLALTVASISRC